MNDRTDDSRDQDPPQVRKGVKVFTWVIVSLSALSVLVAVGTTWLAGNLASERDQLQVEQSAFTARLEEEARAEELAEAVRAEQAAEAAALAERDAVAAESGFTRSPNDDSIYYRGEGGTCSTFLNCSWLTVLTIDDCLAGVYVASSLYASENVVIGSGNSITGGLRAGEAALVEIIYPGASGASGFSEVTQANCLG